MTRFFYPLIIILSFLIAISGCDNTLNAVDEEKGEYSIYGYLDLYADVNFIRVKNLNTNLLQDTVDTIDATVILENLNNGTNETLNDSIVEFDDVKTHNFLSTMNIEPATEYRVSVENADGKVTSATTATPKIAETNIEPVAANCTTQVHLNFDPVINRNALDLKVGFHYDDQEFWVRANKFLIESDEEVIASFTPYDILDDAFALTSPDDVLGGDPLRVFCDRLDNEIFMAQYTHYSSEIHSNNITDTLRITGGTGRFGAFYKDSFTFRIDTTRLCPPYPEEVCVFGHDYLD